MRLTTSGGTAAARRKVGLGRRAPAPAAAAQTRAALPDFDLEGFLEACQPSVEQELRALDVERRARTDGRQNHPPQDALEPGAFEDRIVDGGMRRLNKTAAEGVGALHLLRRDIGEALATLSPPAFETHERDVELALDDRYARIRHDLRDLFKRRLVAERNLTWFRRSHAVERPARYPESMIFHYGLLIFVLVIESVANAYFFAEASDLGLLGGVVQAAVFSLVNVAFAFALGLTAYRFLNSANFGWRALAALGVLVHLAGVVAINLAIAHYRDLIAISPDGATLAVISRVVETPFGLEAFESALLFLIGVLVAAFATWKGYTAEDPIPGYGAAERAFAEADLLCRDTRETLLAEAEEALERAKTPIAADLASFEAAVGSVKDRLVAYRAIANALSVTEDAHQRLVTSLLKTYREENRAVRSERAPAHFDHYPRIVSEIEAPTLDDVEARIALLEDLIEAAREAASESRSRLQGLHEANRGALEVMFAEEEAQGGRLADRSFPGVALEDPAAASPVARRRRSAASHARAALVDQRRAHAAAVIEDDLDDGRDGDARWDDDPSTAQPIDLTRRREARRIAGPVSSRRRGGAA